MSEIVAVTAIGNDRPGIVAAVTRALFDLGCNLEDVTSTILRGHFSMTLIVRASSVGADGIEERLSATADEFDLVVEVRPVEEADAHVEPPTHMISVYGSDKPGIVFRVAEALARLGMNITDLNSRLIGEQDDPVYAMQIEVQAKAGSDLDDVLTPLREELGVELSVHLISADVL